MFTGSIVALVTPYKESLEVDYETLRALVRCQIESGTDGIVALGTTGEHLLLTGVEREDIIATIVEEVAGRIPVIVNVGVASTAQSFQNAQRAKTLGADGFLVVTPYYVKPSEIGVIMHVAEVAKSHYGKGWERFTDSVIEKLCQREDPIVFVLWGRSAKEKCEKIVGQSQHVIISSAHPSPLSAHAGFWGSKPFSKVNNHLIKMGLKPISWSL